jgi:hypothetical protein
MTEQLLLALEVARDFVALLLAFLETVMRVGTAVLVQ